MVKVIKGLRLIKEIERKDVIRKHDQNIKDAFADYGKDTVKQIGTVINTGKRSGRVYKYKGKQHIASAPGEPPAKRSGALSESFMYKARRKELVVYSKLNYAKFLETGTRKMKGKARKLEARPYFKKTNEENSYKLYRSLNDVHA